MVALTKNKKIIQSFTKGNYKEFLLGAIMRFGKNFTFLYSVVEILKNNPTARILVWTNKPGVFRSLETDVNGHIKFSDYNYVSLKEKRDIRILPNKCVVTASKQLLENDKNEDVLNFIENQEWDFIIIDEAHNGVETEKGQKFLNKFKDTRKIFISGTPQKQLGKLQFNDENTFIYDEVSQKKDKENGIWSDAIILKIQLIKILSDSVIDYKKCICDVTGYFTFKKFFSNNKNGLVYCQSVLKFFKDFFGYTKFDKSHNFFGKHNHVVIMVPSNVNGTKMIKQLLDSSEIGEDYVIVAATGENFKRSQLDRAILSGKKTITLLSDMLIEGETVPEWDCAINMSDGTSMFKYLQFAFRPTNPDNNKPNKEAYFYDMNPQRHFLIQNERMKMNGIKGKEKDIYKFSHKLDLNKIDKEAKYIRLFINGLFYKALINNITTKKLYVSFENNDKMAVDNYFKNNKVIYAYGTYEKCPTVEKNKLFEIGLILLQETLKKIN